MADHQAQGDLFYNREHSFDEILIDHALGGPKAVGAYLSTRRNMCVRAVVGAASDGADLTLLQQGVRAFDQAQAILPKIERRSTSKALMMALGPRHLLGLK